MENYVQRLRVRQRKMSMLPIEITLCKYSQGMLGIKGAQWGPSNLHPEATGYGVVIAHDALKIAIPEAI
jgi:glutamate dehydrogenase/leucine dehydrogenase